MRKSLVALDTNHIKQYVFGTNKLKEIRGASSILDYLNRIVMEELARLDPSFNEKCRIYANGGSGLFLIDADKADYFGRVVQGKFKEVTGDGATITYLVQELPLDAPHDVGALLEYPLSDTLALMRYRLQEKKNKPDDIIALSSHPFMRPCDACGVEYANPEEKGKKVSPDPGEENELYCASCQNKRRRDAFVKDSIEEHIEGSKQAHNEYLWVHLIDGLRKREYTIPPKTERPHDFNVFRNFKGAKDYFGLIYADANGMGKKIEVCKTLKELNAFAGEVDEAIYDAVCLAITKHLKIEDHIKPRHELVDTLKNALFPFDMLLLGGDDVMMVVPASVAMDVALTIAKEFHNLMQKKDPEGERYTLSVGVVLAPVKYPFGLLHELVESTLKFAKKKGTKSQAIEQTKYADTRINFMTVTGSTSNSFDKVYTSLGRKGVQVNGHTKAVDFSATLRPYTPEELDILLHAIRGGNKLNLGRTKLHQVREAILKMNLTTSVVEGLAVLRNWKTRQREYVLKNVYEFGERYQMQYSDPCNPASMFPRVTFPWFADGEDRYRTSLLDFVELFDFVSREEDNSNDQA